MAKKKKFVQQSPTQESKINEHKEKTSESIDLCQGKQKYQQQKGSTKKHERIQPSLLLSSDNKETATNSFCGSQDVQAHETFEVENNGLLLPKKSAEAETLFISEFPTPQFHWLTKASTQSNNDTEQLDASRATMIRWLSDHRVMFNEFHTQFHLQIAHASVAAQRMSSFHKTTSFTVDSKYRCDKKLCYVADMIHPGSYYVAKTASRCAGAFRSVSGKKPKTLCFLDS